MQTHLSGPQKAAVFLMQLGKGSIQGFAVTLLIGNLATLFADSGSFGDVCKDTFKDLDLTLLEAGRNEQRSAANDRRHQQADAGAVDPFHSAELQDDIARLREALAYFLFQTLRLGPAHDAPATAKHHDVADVTGID